MTTILIWGAIVAFALGWIVHLIAPEKGANLWIRFGAISALFVFAVGIWSLIRYGAALLHWFRH